MKYYNLQGLRVTKFYQVARFCRLGHSRTRTEIIIAHSLTFTRRFATEEQGFPLCAHPTGPGPQGCDHVSMNEIVYIPMLFYALWQAMYILVVS